MTDWSGGRFEDPDPGVGSDRIDPDAPTGVGLYQPGPTDARAWRSATIVAEVGTTATRPFPSVGQPPPARREPTCIRVPAMPEPGRGRIASRPAPQRQLPDRGGGPRPWGQPASCTASTATSRPAPNVGLSQGGRIVDAVANYAHLPVFGLQPTDLASLGLDNTSAGTREMPTQRAIAAAVRALSPVIITTGGPSLRRAAIRSRAIFLHGCMRPSAAPAGSPSTAR